MDIEITESARAFLAPPPRIADRPIAERLDLLIELTQTTNRLLAALLEDQQAARRIKPALPSTAVVAPAPPSAARARGKAAGK